jgi:hypothetical protein
LNTCANGFHRGCGCCGRRTGERVGGRRGGKAEVAHLLARPSSDSIMAAGELGEEIEYVASDTIMVAGELGRDVLLQEVPQHHLGCSNSHSISSELRVC